MKSLQIRYWFIGVLVLAACALASYDIHSTISAADKRVGTARETSVDEDGAEDVASTESEWAPSAPRIRKSAQVEDYQEKEIKDGDDQNEQSSGNPSMNPELKTLEELHIELNNAFEADESGGAEVASRARAVSAAFQELDVPGLTLGEVRCSAQYCRVEVSHPSTGAQSILTDLQEDSDGPMATRSLYMPRRETQDDGTISATIFVLEPGAMPGAG